MRQASAPESCNFPKCVTSLIAAKADVNKGDTSGHTPLVVVDVWSYLLMAGAHVDRADWIDETASRKAGAKGN